MSDSPDELKTALHDFMSEDSDGRLDAARRFYELLKKPNGSSESPKNDVKGCPEDVVDCSEILSPCCSAPILNVFGTLPLQVECKACGKRHFMGELIRNSLKAGKNSTEV
jgi:hypothetical protein